MEQSKHIMIVGLTTVSIEGNSWWDQPGKIIKT